MGYGTDLQSSVLAALLGQRQREAAQAAQSEQLMWDRSQQATQQAASAQQAGFDRDIKHRELEHKQRMDEANIAGQLGGVQQHLGKPVTTESPQDPSLARGYGMGENQGILHMLKREQKNQGGDPLKYLQRLQGQGDALRGSPRFQAAEPDIRTAYTEFNKRLMDLDLEASIAPQQAWPKIIQAKAEFQGLMDRMGATPEDIYNARKSSSGGTEHTLRNAVSAYNRIASIADGLVTKLATGKGFKNKYQVEEARKVIMQLNDLLLQGENTYYQTGQNRGATAESMIKAYNATDIQGALDWLASNQEYTPRDDTDTELDW